jgi:ABC-type uncharacterized transport system substrate-binding protein
MDRQHPLLTACTAAIFAVVAWMAIIAPPLALPEAEAHPHVFIVQRLNVIFDEKGLAGIRVRWKFDDMFASMIAHDHDANGNGIFEAEEVQAVKELAFSYISEQSYFSFISIDGTPFDVKYIQDFNAVLKDQALVYEFLIPCHVTATDQPKRVKIASYDPSYYAAIFFTRNQPVSLTAAERFDIKTSLREDPDTRIFFDMVHPWTLFMEFRKK